MERHLSDDDEQQQRSASSSSSDEEQEGETWLPNALANVRFELLQKAKAEGFTGVSRRKADKETGSKRLNKNRPMEISSKKPVRMLRDVIQAPKRTVCDPRFESLCGKFDESRFKKSYSFIYDDNLPSERQEVFDSMKKIKDPESRKEAKQRLVAIDRQLKAETDRRKSADTSREQKRKEREQVDQGKKPYYMKKSDKRKEELIHKYAELKKSGKLDTFLEKRRRKNAAKDHRYMPYRRPTSGEA